MRKRIVEATPMICVIAYLCLGFMGGYWHPGWVVFFAIPVVSCLLSDNGARFIYPIFCIAAYIAIGYVFNYWHPGWIIFLTIPVYYTLFPGIRKRRIE